MTKFVINDKIYIPVDEFIHKMSIDMDVLSDYIVTTPYTKVISEEDFNMLLQNGILNIEENDNHIELTKVESLTATIRNVKALRPLKYMFLSKYEDDETIKQRIIKEEIEEYEKAIRNLSRESNFSDRVEKKIRNNRELTRNANEKLKTFDLSVQTITELHDGKIGFCHFVVGNGIFYEMSEDDLTDEGLDTYEHHGGSLRFCSADYGDWVEIAPENDHDFRNDTALDNIAWCLSNIKMSNEFTDSLSCNGKGINFMVTMNLLMKYVNPFNESNHLFVNGIPEVSGKVIISTNDKETRDEDKM